MSIKDRLRSWLGVDERALTFEKVFGTGADTAWWTSVSASGEPVTAETAMRAAAGACVRLLADDISSLPVDVFVKDGPASIPVGLPPWMVSPSGRPNDLFLTYISDWVTSIGTDGNAYTLCLPNVRDIQYVEVLDPSATEPLEDRPGQFRTPTGRIVGEDQLLHVPWVRLPGRRKGINPVQGARDSIGLEVAAQKWAGAFFREGGTLGGIVEVPGGPETVDADKLRESFQARHRGAEHWWKPAVLTGGAKYQNDALKPAEAELAPLWQHVLEEAARIYHIPPHLLASQAAGGASYASIEERGIAYVRHAVRPFTTRFERAHALLLPPGQQVKLNMNALLRGDAKARAEYYRQMLDAKAMKREEVREKEDLPWDGELGYLETPNNNPPAPAGTAAPDEPRSLSIDTVTIADAGARRIADTATAGAAIAAAEAKRTAEATNARLDALEASFVEAITAHSEVIGRLSDDKDRIYALLEQRNRPPDIRIDGDFVYYQRGAEVERKRVTRDETGRVIGMVAA